jgi:hypothetical protein
MCGAGKRWGQGRAWQRPVQCAMATGGARGPPVPPQRSEAASCCQWPGSRTLDTGGAAVPSAEARALGSHAAVGRYDDCGWLLRRLRLPCYTCDGHFCTTGTGTATDGAKRVRRGADREPQLVTQTQPYGPYGCGHEPPHAPSSSSFQRPRAARATGSSCSPPPSATSCRPSRWWVVAPSRTR